MKTSLRQFCGAFFIVVAVAAALTSQALGAYYTAVDLNPDGFNNSCAWGISGNQQVGNGGGPATGVNTHALLWNGTAESFNDLNPSGFDYSYAWGISGNQQVGSGLGSATDGNYHALLWNGTAESFIDLNPSGFTSSGAFRTNGTQQVGWGNGSATGENTHALLWNGSAESYVDLNPGGFTESWAYGISGNQQVGYGQGPATSGNRHALLWNGSAESYIDLNPDGFDYSVAYDTNGAQQVGYGWGPATDGNTHALLWNGSAESYVDLNPNGFDFSSAYGIRDNQQVGFGFGPATDGNAPALLWNGSSTDYIDLFQILPTGFHGSYAYSIDVFGNIVGEADAGYTHAILWQPILPVCSEQIPSDLNGDCKVDFEDFAIMASHWLQKGYVKITKFAFDTNSIWTTQGQWQFGEPLGMGGSLHGYPDPNQGFTGQNVYGVNLNGDYDLAVGGPYYLTAGPFNCSEYGQIELYFARWLNSDASNYVKCTVEVSNNGGDWQIIWINPSDTEITDNQWKQQYFDISGVADRQPTVYIRWSYQIISDRAFPYSGWNIDDMELQGLPN
jgi:hypothetical protein